MPVSLARVLQRLFIATCIPCAILAHAQEQPEGPLPALNGAPVTAHKDQSEAMQARELDNEAVIRMTLADVGDSIIAQAVRTQSGHYRTGPDDIIALKKAGVSERVISAMLARSSGLTQRPDLRPVEITPLSPDVDDPGVYFKNKQGQWEPVSPELVKYRDGGALKSVFTNNIVKKDRNGVVSGGKASLSIAPGTEMMILAPRQADPVEYLIVRFREHSDRREFRIQTGNVFHSETGTDRDQLEIPIHKVTSRVFSFTVPADLKKGQYGVLPPGSASTPGISYAGKMYTFAVNE